MGLILASKSPRRKQLLATLGLDFSTCPSAPLDEAAVLADASGSLEERLLHLAQLKGAQAAEATPQDIVLSADTAVVIGGDVLGKPREVDEAREMLTRLSGRAHHVITALCVQQVAHDAVLLGSEKTRVTFHLLDVETIDRYIARAQPFDKAGAYAIQGVGALLVRKIEGDYTNVVGLPLGLTARLLAQAGLRVL